ncbi:MAG: lysozyme inhibitor LprI family protein [Pyrinomonadaceae bacterium]
MAVAAQSEAKHPIDRQLDKCLSVKHGTMPRAECYSKAFEAWDKDVSTTYAKLKETLPAAQVEPLVAAQASWEHYRDDEFGFIAALYAKRRGTGYISTRIILRTEIVKARAVLLEGRERATGGAQ